MGVGPVFAIPAALKNCGMSLDDVDLFEVSCLVVACVMVTNLPRLTKLLRLSACT